MKDFLSQSSIQEKFSSWNVQGKYDTKKIIFEEILKNELVVKGIAKKEELDKYDNPLENLHKCLNDSKKTLDDTEQNQVSVNFYDISEDFKKEYIKFLKNYVANLFLEPIYIQEVPTFRFHFPFQKGDEWEDR